MVRFYGKAPYKIAVIHGGPGDIGSLEGVARHLGTHVGVLEPLQSQYNVVSLVMELRRQLERHEKDPMILIGHSWGAWLASLTAACYPFLVRRVVLVGCPPLEQLYTEHIHERRMRKLMPKEHEQFHWYMTHMDRIAEQEWKELRNLLEKTDYYEKIPDVKWFGRINGNMYERIWVEAAAMRQNGELLRYIQSVTCPIDIIHGEQDPHPLEGVVVPLDRLCIPYRLYALPKCGHVPFIEVHAVERFYEILDQIIQS